MKNLKSRIKDGETVHGSWLNLGSGIAAEIMGHAGFDWLLIDREHGNSDDSVMVNQLQALASCNVTPLVRTGEATRARVQQILDSGAHGIMFPQIQTAEEAEAAIRLMYYPPKGMRGMAKMIRAANFGKTFDQYLSGLENQLLGMIQIETANAVREVEKIAAIDGVDVLFVGPTDLSIALGTFGQLHHPTFQQALRDVANAANKFNKAAGVLMMDISEYKMYADLGYRFLACGGDTQFILKGASTIAENMKERMGQI